MQSNIQAKVLIFARYYLPGYTAGGPIRSISNLVEMCGDSIEFYIYTNATDPRDEKPYQNIIVNQWVRVGKAYVFYASEEKKNYQTINQIIYCCNFTHVYVNSFFSYIFSILPVLLVNKCKMRLVLAPRGELSEGALSIKKVKKNIYLRLFNILRISKNIYYHATSKQEKSDLVRILGATNIEVIENIPSINHSIENIFYPEKIIKIIYLSRITPKKNLIYAMQVLKRLKIQILFDIFGPIDDGAYWVKCQKIIKELPFNIKASYNGTVMHKDINRTLQKYDMLFLPSLNENFGHIIPESLSNGCLPLISDNTPWVGLEDNKAGWDINLQHPDLFIEAINQYAANSLSERLKMKQKAFRFIHAKFDLKEIKLKYMRLFD